MACAVERRRFPVGASPTRQTLQPEATGAVMEVTKWLKPSESASRIGDGASVQAVTRVNAEQALYGAFEVKHIFYTTLYFLHSSFFVRLGIPFLRPDPHKTTPAGTSPVVARRHKAISNLRARATIIVLRFLPPSVRVRYHWANALSF